MSKQFLELCVAFSPWCYETKRGNLVYTHSDQQDGTDSGLEQSSCLTFAGVRVIAFVCLGASHVRLTLIGGLGI